MLSNVGHTIQKLINNIPISISVNETTSSVVTNGGNVYQAGLIGSKIHCTFEEILSSNGAIGKITNVEAVQGSLYLLSSSGSVYQYFYSTGQCSNSIREVYSPAACGGDNAISIKAGRAHVLIYTEGKKVYGAGDNSHYQLVPQGQCRYDTAVEIIITDTNVHDNNCCTSFVGTYTELDYPVIPQCNNQCNNISCIKDNKCDAFVGYLDINNVTINTCTETLTGVLGVPVYGDYNYVGFLCVDSNGCVSGTVTYNVTRLYIKCGGFVVRLIYNDCEGCHKREFNASSTKEILLFNVSSETLPHSYLCTASQETPITGTLQVSGRCGNCAVANIALPCGFPVPTVNFDSNCNTLLLSLNQCTSTLTLLCDSSLAGYTATGYTAGYTGCTAGYTGGINLDLDFDVPLNCCQPQVTSMEVTIPQPCWAGIYAGYDTSVLVDNCNRIYVLGSIHQIRSNRDLLKRSCIEDLLSKTSASIVFPADQLNCGNFSAKNSCHNVNAPNKVTEKPFKTDLNKFGISLNFTPNTDQCSNNMTVCDFLKNLQQCNESTNCSTTSTCTTCDSYIYINISGDCGCSCGAPSAPPLGSLTLFNKKSICKLVSQGCPDKACISADENTIVEFDLNKYCINATDVSLDKIVKLDFCVEGPNVNIYIDIDQPGGIKLTTGGSSCNIEYTMTASSSTHQFILNYGSIIDPVELTNLKYALSLDCYYPCSKFKNPFNTKITNTYLQGGDRVRFVIGNPKNIRQAITPDIPTVFRINRRVLDIGVGHNNLSILAGGLSCPNDIYVIGQNCHGELGLGTNETIVCFKEVNRCQFDCQVKRIFSGRTVTFYITQSYSVYASGQWKNYVNSSLPLPVTSICRSWKIVGITISDTHALMIGNDGIIFGLGDNSVGELGLCNLENVRKPTPLSFFYVLSNKCARQLSEGLAYPPSERSLFNVLPRSDGDGDLDAYGRNLSRMIPRKYYPNGRIAPSKYRY